MARHPDTEGNDLRPRGVDAQQFITLPTYASDSDAPTDTLFWHSGESTVKHKDEQGTVTSGGLSDGENFNGQNSSTFSNLASLETDTLDTSIETGADVTASRSLDTTYQNTTGHLLDVTVVLINTTGSTANMNIYLYVANNSADIGNAGTTVGRFRLDINDDNQIAVNTQVPDGAYYKMESFGNESLNTWNERGYNT